MEKIIRELLTKIKDIKADPNKALKLPDNTFFMEDDLVLSGMRKKGVSRYPYSRDGLVIWAFHNGYITANEGNFTVFRPSYTDEIPCMGFFAGKELSDGSFFPISVSEANSQLFEPFKVERYTVYSPSAVYYIADSESITFCVRIFVSKDKKINFTLSALNNTSETQKIYLASFFEALLRFEEREDFWSKGARDSFVNENGNFRLHTTHVKENYLAMNTRTLGSAFTARYTTTSFADFVGMSGRSFVNAESLRAGRFEKCENITKRTSLPIAGNIIHFDIPAGGEARMDHSFTFSNDLAFVNEMINDTTIPSSDFEAEIETLQREAIEAVDSVNISFGDWTAGKLDPAVLGRFLRTVQRQVSFCAFGKCYAGPLLGVRDVFQQLEGALIWDRKTAREKILSAYNYIDPTGRPPRQFSVSPTPDILPKIDSRPFIDQGVWMIDTVYTYLAYTDDYSILDEECGYYILPTTYIGSNAQRCDRRDSLLCHMIQVMDYLLSNLDTECGTGCLRILFGDWNDAIDGLGASLDPGKKFGSGVSVMTTLQLYRCLREMSDIFTHLGIREDKIENYREIRKSIREGFFKYAVKTNEKGEKRIVHGWGDKLSYYVGSFCDSDGKDRISFASNSFYAISGMIDEDMSLKQTAIDALRSLDSRFGLMTLLPAFSKDTKGVGRISSTIPGTAENACAYVHASMFSICALFAMGESEYAWEQLEKSIVISHEEPSLTTFVMPNSYIDNKEYNMNGESAGDWFTGSGAVLLKGLIKYGFGIKPSLDGLVLELPLNMPSSSIDIKIPVKGTSVNISYRRSNSGARRYIVNGSEYKAEINPVTNAPRIFIDTESLKEASIEVLD
ncbi:MAG: hypothetical protein U0M06_04285 [Clostridia bacterium]|nr:hypothetical protein [Clostridia bacterium]